MVVSCVILTSSVGDVLHSKTVMFRFNCVNLFYSFLIVW